LDIVIVETTGKRVALDLSTVEEMLTLGPITPVPLASPAVLGATNVRGNVVAVLDLGLLVGLSSRTAVRPTLGLLTECQGFRVVLGVQHVEGVVSTEPSALEPPLLDLPQLLGRVLKELEAGASRFLSSLPAPPVAAGEAAGSPAPPQDGAP